MNDILVLPTGALADASLAIARSSVSRSIVDHSIRSFLFARLLADDAGYLNDADYDEDLLFAATVMHDLGLGEHATGEARFEVEGADLAAAVLRKHRVAEARAVGLFCELQFGDALELLRSVRIATSSAASRWVISPVESIITTPPCRPARIADAVSSGSSRRPNLPLACIVRTPSAIDVRQRRSRSTTIAWVAGFVRSNCDSNALSGQF
jgi:hypothetical protein